MSEHAPEPTPEPLLQQSQAERPIWPKMALGAGALVAAALVLPMVLRDGGPTPPPHPAVATAPPAGPPAGATPAPLVTRPAVDDTGACTLRVPELARNEGGGTVIGFEDQAISLARVDLTQKQSGGQIDPAYRNNLRVIVRMDSGGTRVHVAPGAMPVRLGDRVTMQDIHRNPALPCNYFPPMITADLGPATAANFAGVPGGSAP